MIIGQREAWTGRLLLIVLIAITIIPFLSLLTTALHPSESVPPGLAWPSDPQWGNFLEAFDQAGMGALLLSSVLIVLGVVPAAVIIATMAGFAIGHLRIPGARSLFILFLGQLLIPWEGAHLGFAIAYIVVAISLILFDANRRAALLRLPSATKLALSGSPMSDDLVEEEAPTASPAHPESHAHSRA